MILKYKKQLSLIQPYLKQQDLLTRKLSKKNKKLYLLKKKKSIFSFRTRKIKFCKPFYKDLYLSKSLFFMFLKNKQIDQSPVALGNNSSWDSSFLFRPFVFHLPLLIRDIKGSHTKLHKEILCSDTFLHNLVQVFYKDKNLLYSKLDASTTAVKPGEYKNIVPIKNLHDNQIKTICYKKSLKDQLYKKVDFVQKEKLCLSKKQIDQKAKPLYIREEKEVLKDKKNYEIWLENKVSEVKQCNFYELDSSQKLQLLYPTNLDKMSFLSTDLANLSLSLDTYTFLKKRNIQKLGNLLEYTPKDLLQLLNLNRDMFVEIKTCFLLLGVWKKNSLV